MVSGIEGVMKPDAAIYRLLLDRNGLDAADCLVIDDTAANVTGAQAVGLDGIHFRDAPGLADALDRRGIACTAAPAPL